MRLHPVTCNNIYNLLDINFNNMKFFLNIILFLSLLSSQELLILDDFESGNFESLEWNFEGDYGWQIDSINAYDFLSAHSDTSLTHNQSSILTLIADAGCLGDSEIKFYRRVSTEEDYDFLSIFLGLMVLGCFLSWLGSKG